jgi:hypothetical protein
MERRLDQVEVVQWQVAFEQSNAQMFALQRTGATRCDVRVPRFAAVD